MGPSVHRVVEGVLQGQKPDCRLLAERFIVLYASYMSRPSALSLSLESGLSALG